MIKESVQLSVWLWLRAGLQGVTTLFLARLLGPNDYGLYVSVLAMVTTLLPFLVGGPAFVYIADRQSTLTRPQLASRWLRFAVLAGLALSFAMPLLVIAIMGAGSYPWVWTLLTVNELVFGVIVEIAARHNQAVGRPNGMGFWQVLPHATRLMGLGALVGLGFQVDLQTWVVTSLILGGVVAVFALRQVPFAKDPDPALSAIIGLFRSSVHYSSGGVAIRLMSEIDKPLVTRMSEPAAASGLSLAQRVVELASLPLHAVIATSLPRLLAAESNAAAAAVWARALFLPMSYALASGALVAVAARPIAALFGSGYSDMVWALQWLGWLPAMTFLRGMLSNALALLQRSSDYAAGHWVGAVVRLATCAALLWLMGWKGAVASLAIAECVVSVFLMARLVGAVRDRSPQALQQGRAL